MLAHPCPDIRVASRTQALSAGHVPVLREAARLATTTPMSDRFSINVPRLRRDILDATRPGSGVSRRALSLKATDGRNPDAVRDIFRVDKRVPSFDTVAGFARAMDKPFTDYILGAKDYAARREMPVVGSVAAGVWREQTEWPQDEWFVINVGPAPLAGKRTGLVVDGRSMDKVFPPGTILDCVDVIDAGVTVQDGDYVIVERRQGNLHEVTVKKARKLDAGGWELVAESTLPDFQDPISIDNPDPATAGDYEVRVKAIVVWAHQLLYRPEQQKIRSSGS